MVCGSDGQLGILCEVFPRLKTQQLLNYSISIWDHHHRIVFMLTRTPNHFLLWLGIIPWPVPVGTKPIFSSGICYVSNSSLAEPSRRAACFAEIWNTSSLSSFRKSNPSLQLHCSDQTCIYKRSPKTTVDSFRCHNNPILTTESCVLIPHCCDFHRIAFLNFNFF